MLSPTCLHTPVRTYRQTEHSAPAPALCHRATGRSRTENKATPLTSTRAELPVVLCKAGDEETGTNGMKSRKEKSGKESLSIFSRPRKFSSSSKNKVAAESRQLAVDHSWPPLKQQQPAGPPHSLGTQDPSQRDPSCLLALGHRARESWCFTPLLRQTSSWPARPAGKQPRTRREGFSASSALPRALAVLQGEKTGTSQGPAQGLGLAHQVVSISLDGDPQPPWAGPPSQGGVLQREEKLRGPKCFTSPQKEQ